MKKAIVCCVLAVLCGHSLKATDLYFSSGSVSSYTNVNLTLSGPSNLVAFIQRLNRTNDTWEAYTSTTLTNGTGTVTAKLIENIYGFYRAYGTNSGTVLYSTNAYGAVVGTVSSNYTLVGNLFSTTSFTSIMPDPADGTQVYKWNPVSSAYSTYTYDLPSWTPSTPSIDTAEGFIVRNPALANLQYVISGLFDTNSFTKTIYTNLNLITCPLYHINPTNTWRVDTLDGNNVGGVMGLPVQTTGYDPQSILYQQLTTTPTYTTNNLVSSNFWQHIGTNVTIGVNITEGFWLNKSGLTNTTWTFRRSIW